ncbi:MAG: lysostaphin resistance A-like protein [Prochloraceae cyanobacterium]
MNNSLETEPKNIFSKLKARYIFLGLVLINFGWFLVLVLTSRILRIFNPDLWQFIFRENIFLLDPIVYIISFGVICWLVFKKMKADRISLKYILGKFPLKKLKWSDVWIVIFASQFFFIGISVLTRFFITLIFPDSATNLIENANQIFIYDGNNLGLKIIYWLLIFVAVVIVAPIAEEFLFRGVILHRWATKWGVVPAILLSSFCFGLIHFNIFFLNLAIWSVFLAFLYLQTGNLIVPIIAHAFNNFLAFLAMLGGSISTASDSATAATEDSLKIILIVIFLASIPLCYWLKSSKFTSKVEHLPYFTNQKGRQKVKEEVSRY